MAHLAHYGTLICGDDQGRDDVTIGPWDRLDIAHAQAKLLDAAGHDCSVVAWLLSCDENMIVNDMIRGGWGDHCFGELFSNKHDPAFPGVIRHDYKKCLFYKGGDGSKNIPIAWLDERANNFQGTSEYVWRLLPDGIQHYLENYSERTPLFEAVAKHLRELMPLRSYWMEGYETRRL